MARLWSVLCVLVARGVRSFAPLEGVTARPLDGGAPVDLGARLASGTQLVVLGTYAADFNAIEYCQRVAHYAPKLRARGVEGCTVVLNAEPEAAIKLRDLLALDAGVDVLCDPSGAAGRAFGVGRGWRPDDDDLRIGGLSIPLNAYGKLFGMLLGLGAWATLPAVVGGYLGNPWVAQPWIEDALVQGQAADRWPAVVDVDGGAVTRNPFADLPLVGGWKRRPLELATLRLQNMVGVSLAHWDALKPSTAEARVLTQLGGCVLSDGKGGAAFEWRDPGICAVANFEDVLAALDAAPPAEAS